MVAETVVMMAFAKGFWKAAQTAWLSAAAMVWTKVERKVGRMDFESFVKMVG